MAGNRLLALTLVLSLGANLVLLLVSRRSPVRAIQPAAVPKEVTSPAARRRMDCSAGIAALESEIQAARAKLDPRNHPWRASAGAARDPIREARVLAAVGRLLAAEGKDTAHTVECLGALCTITYVYPVGARPPLSLSLRDDPALAPARLIGIGTGPAPNDALTGAELLRERVTLWLGADGGP